MEGGITRFLPNDEYQAAIGANSPSFSNVYATMADISGAAQDLNSVMTNGSTAVALTTDVIIITTGVISLQSSTGTDVAEIYLEDSVGAALAYTNSSGEQSLSLFASEITLTDTINDQGIVTAADFSPNYVPRSYTDKNYQDTHLGGKEVTALVTGPLVGQDGYAVTWDNTAGKYTLTAGGGNGIYGGSGSTPNDTEVTIGNDLVFIGATNTAVQSIRFQNSDDSQSLIWRNDGRLINSGNIVGGKIGTTGATFAYYLDIIAASGVKMAQFRPAVGNGSLIIDAAGANDPRIVLIDNGGVTKGNIRSSGTSYLINPFALGQNSVDSGVMFQVVGGDVVFEGASLSTEFLFDESTNRTHIGAGTSGVSKLNIYGDVEIVGGANGYIYEDRTTGTKYRAYIDNNQLFWEAV